MNLSIVMPGSCNGKCPFCFWKETKMHPDWLTRLSKYFDLIPEPEGQPVKYSLSITGGEPTMSPMLGDLLSLVHKHRHKFIRTVLTTNGSYLEKYLKVPFNGDFQEAIQHVNISRHHYKDDVNCKVFGTKDVPDTGKLEKLICELNKLGIDASLNCVLSTIAESETDCVSGLSMIGQAKMVGASAVNFRHPNALEKFEDSPFDKSFDDYRCKDVSECPVCKIKHRMIHGMHTYFSYGLIEPSRALEDIYELIFHPAPINGHFLTADWAGKLMVKYIKRNDGVLLPMVDIEEMAKHDIEYKLKWQDMKIQSLERKLKDADTMKLLQRLQEEEATGGIRRVAANTSSSGCGRSTGGSC